MLDYSRGAIIRPGVKPHDTAVSLFFGILYKGIQPLRPPALASCSVNSSCRAERDSKGTVDHSLH